MARSILIAVFTHSDNTRRLAELIRTATGGTLFEIRPWVAYPAAYNTVVAQAKKEIQGGHRPPLAARVEDLVAYDTVFVGSPNWWGTIAPPVATFLETHDLSAKTVIPFCTHGGGGVGGVEREIGRLCPGARVLAGLAVHGGSARAAEVSAWLARIGLTEG